MFITYCMYCVVECIVAFAYSICTFVHLPGDEVTSLLSSKVKIMKRQQLE